MNNLDCIKPLNTSKQGADNERLLAEIISSFSIFRFRKEKDLEKSRSYSDIGRTHSAIHELNIN